MEERIKSLEGRVVELQLELIMTRDEMAKEVRDVLRTVHGMQNLSSEDVKQVVTRVDDVAQRLEYLEHQWSLWQDYQPNDGPEEYRLSATCTPRATAQIT